jgi:hypothetical protein
MAVNRQVSNDWDFADDGRSWGDCKGGIGAPPLPLGEAVTEEETGADNVEPFPEHQPQVAAEAVGHGGRMALALRRRPAERLFV